MDTVINVGILFLGFVTAVISITEETWKKDPHIPIYKRATRAGWIAIAAFFLILLLGFWKERRAAVEQSQAKSDRDSLQSQLSASIAKMAAVQSDVMFTKKNLIAALRALELIANQQSPSSTRVATQTLDNIFSLKSSSLVKVRAVVEGELREKSGFFFNQNGHVLTADFAVADSESRIGSQISVETIDGRSYPAQVVRLEPNLAIAVLDTNMRNKSSLMMGVRQPSLKEQVLVLGFTPEDFLTRTVGTISKIENVSGLYSRDRTTLQGFGGGPVLDTEGSVIGVNWGALDPPVPGSARFMRGDRISDFLQKMGLL